MANLCGGVNAGSVIEQKTNHVHLTEMTGRV